MKADATKEPKLPKGSPKKKQKLKNAKRLKKYMKFMKKNYDWDYMYIIDLLRYKIKRVRKYIKKHDIIENEKLDAIVTQMQETENLLDRVLHHNYRADLELEFAKKFGGNIKSKIIHKKRIQLQTDYSEIKPEFLEDAKLAYSQLYRKEHELIKADLKKAFDIMTENIWDWWD